MARTHLKSLILAVALLLGLGIPDRASGAILFSEAHVITGSNSIGLTRFTVTVPGTFDIYTMGPTIDPFIELFTDTGVFTTGNLLGSADDNCSVAICGPAGSFANGIITLALGIGDYVAAVTDCCVSMIYLPGYNRGTEVDTVSIVVASANGQVTRNVAIPEPASVAVLGLGLLGLGFARRRRHPR